MRKLFSFVFSGTRNVIGWVEKLFLAQPVRVLSRFKSHSATEGGSFIGSFFFNIPTCRGELMCTLTNMAI